MSTATWTRTRLLHELDRPADVFRNLGPNWFAAVMGTGIVANAAATLPVRVTGLHTAAFLVWLLASVLLVALVAGTAVHWARHREAARGHHLNPAMAPFYGAPPMALLTIAAGTVTFGPELFGTETAVGIGAVLWTAGTLAGLASAVAVPYLMITRHDLRLDSVFATWLMPVVPPMVSAATGPLLVPHLAHGEARTALLFACYAMFGISLFATVALLPLIWTRLVLHRTGPAVMVPTLWIVLGPLGQSVTAANTLGSVAHVAVSPQLASAFEAFGILYGIPVLGFALVWMGLAAALTWRAARSGLPFAMTWWGFTFPVGTCVTGATGLAVHTGSTAFKALAVALYVLLVAAWLVVGTRTARGCLSGRLFRTPPAAPAAATATAAAATPAVPARPVPAALASR
ncbi:TDT family transporter [Yinghuangia soli]|uniref:TDT family transporter n=1 Tax=Yinghuangia soli TaxID=2908204 RepID=A0AA41PW32_9ACTN|nr:TDT family transporter [Yinghuangia soli]MCF2525969.1 TDT family transporter [Yinghuangia soli]